MKLNIDFTPKGQRKSPYHLGLGCLLLALLACIAWTMTGEIEARSPDHQIETPSGEEVQAINRAIDDLNFPWLEVLTLVETSIDSATFITRLDADAREGKLSLHGEAHDSRAVLELPARLRASRTVRDARVTGQSPANSSVAMIYPISFGLEVTFHSAGKESP